MSTPELLNEKNVRNGKINGKSVASASVRAVELYSGPIPSASELAKYEDVLPGAADRILGMAERQAQHRHKIENKMLDASITAERAGQIFGFIIGLFVYTRADTKRELKKKNASKK